MTDVDQERLRRAAENQSLFREVNERVEELNNSFEAFTQVGEWVCECAVETCVERIAMTMAEYRELRSDSNRFAVIPGHEIPDVERIVDRRGGYVVVSKIGVGAEVAAALDQRRKSSAN